jgi:hypothetical protein
MKVLIDTWARWRVKVRAWRKRRHAINTFLRIQQAQGFDAAAVRARYAQLRLDDRQ